MLDQWDRIWSYSSYYVERLKTVEITLTGLEEVTTVVTEFEMKLASYDSMPSDMDNLRKAHDDLMTLEADIQEKQVHRSTKQMCNLAKSKTHFSVWNLGWYRVLGRIPNKPFFLPLHNHSCIFLPTAY